MELLATLVRHLVGRGDGADCVLVFMPGVLEITRAIEAFEADGVLGDTSRVSLLPLHAQLSTTEQKRVFRPAQRGRTKVVVSTNIAEVSPSTPRRRRCCCLCCSHCCCCCC